MSDEELAEGLQQIDHPEREYVHVVEAFPDSVKAEYLYRFKALVGLAYFKKMVEEDPLKAMDAFSEAIERSQLGDCEAHREAEGIA